MEIRWAQYWANKYYWAVENRSDIDSEDLLQAALMGEYIARSKYNPEKGSFANFSAYFIKNEIRDLLGIKDGKIPPILLSLDEPVGGEESEITRQDQLEDKSLPDVDEKLYMEERKNGIRDAVERLSDPQQREVLRLCYLEGKGAKATGEQMGIPQDRVYKIFQNARRQLRRDRILKRLVNIDQEIPYYARIGVKNFNSMHTSAVELAAIILDEKRQRLQAQLTHQAY